jgi:hypothetical protein
MSKDDEGVDDDNTIEKNKTKGKRRRKRKTEKVEQKKKNKKKRRSKKKKDNEEKGKKKKKKKTVAKKWTRRKRKKVGDLGVKIMTDPVNCNELTNELEKNRNIKLNEIAQVKNSCVLTFLKRIKTEKSMISVKASINKSAELLKKLMPNFGKMLNEFDFSILASKTKPYFNTKLYETINKMFQFSGIMNKMSSNEMKKYVVYSPKEVMLII